MRLTVSGMASLVAALLLAVVAMGAYAAETPVDLAVRFPTNFYTGVEVSPNEWLAESTRETHVFEKSGRLNALVKQSTARATHLGA